MRRLAVRRRTDIGTILLHWLVVITLMTLVATGLRIAADEPEHAWLLVFDRVLPKRVVWTGHLPAALILIAYLISARLFRRVKIDRIRMTGLLRTGQARWNAINVLLYWIFFCRDDGRICHRSPTLLGSSQQPCRADPSARHMDHSRLRAGAHCNTLGDWRFYTTGAHFSSGRDSVCCAAIRSDGIAGTAQPPNR